MKIKMPYTLVLALKGRQAAMAVGLFNFHHKVKSTGFQPVSFSIENEGVGWLRWITDTEVTRYFRLSITLCG
jgi:hypothetical protein